MTEECGHFFRQYIRTDDRVTIVCEDCGMSAWRPRCTGSLVTTGDQCKARVSPGLATCERHDPDAMAAREVEKEERRCIATKKDGHPCQLASVRGSDRCMFHRREGS